jgi:hypothetical protein
MTEFNPRHQYGCEHAISMWPVDAALFDLLKARILPSVKAGIPEEYLPQVTWHLVPPVDDADLLEDMRPAYIYWLYDGRKD